MSKFLHNADDTKATAIPRVFFENSSTVQSKNIWPWGGVRWSIKHVQSFKAIARVVTEI